MNVENVGEFRKWLAGSPKRSELLRVARGFGWQGRKGTAPRLRDFVEGRVSEMGDNQQLPDIIVTLMVAMSGSEPEVKAAPAAEPAPPPADEFRVVEKRITVEPARRLILRIGSIEITGSPEGSKASLGPSRLSRVWDALTK